MSLPKVVGIVVFGVLPLGIGGCRTGARRRAELVAAIDRFYEGAPACLWFEPVEMPVEVDAADAQGRDGLEALVGQGLLVRTRIDADGLSPAGMRYELTRSGRAAWRPEAGHAGFGNLCYGVTRVVEVGSAVRRRDAVLGEVTDVAYMTQLSGAAPWTLSGEVKEAFPRLKMELTGPMPGSAVLQETKDGWRVAGVMGSLGLPGKEGDGEGSKGRFASGVTEGKRL